MLAAIHDPILRVDVENFVGSNPQSAPLIGRIIAHFVGVPPSEILIGNGKRTVEEAEEHLKAEELLNGGLAQSGSLQKKPHMEFLSFQPLFTAREVSFQSPVRKKLDLVIGQNGLRLLGKGGTSELDLALSKRDRKVLCVPTPDKAKEGHFTVAIFFGAESGEPSSQIGPASQVEPLVFTLDDKPLNVVDSSSSANSTSLKKAHFLRTLSQHLHCSVVEPDVGSFQSSRKATASGVTHRGPKYFASVYLGAKESFLFPLADGVFVGLRKPFLFVPVQNIKSMKLSSITSRTFNLDLTVSTEVITAPGFLPKPSASGSTTLEFSMIDHEEYEGIMSYIREQKSGWDTLSTGVITERVDGEARTTDSNEDEGAEDVADGSSDEDDEDYMSTESSEEKTVRGSRRMTRSRAKGSALQELPDDGKSDENLDSDSSEDESSGTGSESEVENGEESDAVSDEAMSDTEEDVNELVDG
ncbi:hypothetical protein M427DRAFT_57964 [Gonapodya prolifera JEL478]|uniref:Histone chaperone RTT106/FACT complex subunit SPT16-like middle domain-containing protein n=1 Tax=Gonapodya prolifera (strain JEL478) TaxID=1344416 RepID=A0A139AAV0_GONPJ|nr:hypothetical protein M427DRAFT_57964 [Gonapodya prolifera JEL478]|eukprot:KXS13952.1 hypothetical protein M427DRAFT_57964 [Gonapodya prolifera JEL478]